MTDSSEFQNVSLKVPYSDSSIKISFVLVTPELAKKWLKTNVEEQRKLNQGLVNQYASQMKKGLWSCETGESIKFSEKGLIDGQHRLNAIILNDEPIVMMVIEGLKSESITKMDMGKRRNLSDIFKIRGVELPKGLNESVLSSVVSGIYTAKEYMKVSRADSNSLRIDSGSRVKPSPVELYEFLMANPEILDRLSKLSKFKVATTAKSVPLGPTITSWFLCDIINEKVAEDLFKTFEECTPQTEAGRACPSYKLFQMIQRNRVNRVNINKYEYQPMWLWALDLMLRGNSNVGRVSITRSCMPGQGHEGSTELKEYFRNLKTVS